MGDHEQGGNTTVLLNQKNDFAGSDSDIQPTLFVCFEHEIMEFPLSGRQQLGRPSAGRIPDIPVTNKYVSRNHGSFETADGKVIYIPAESSNGTMLGKNRLVPGEPIELQDGDELIIPASDGAEGVDVMLVCALSRNRINIWKDLMLSAKDTLTGLPLRNTFRTWFLMNHGWDNNSKICVFLLDIDKFKTINDTYGHTAGDNALKILSEQLIITADTTGYVCRWGGDEFAGILTGTAKEVKTRLNDMRKRIAGIKIDGKFKMTISAGVLDISSVGGDKKDIDRLIGIVDKALYKAKEKGRNCVCAIERAPAN